MSVFTRAQPPTHGSYANATANECITEKLCGKIQNDERKNEKSIKWARKNIQNKSLEALSNLKLCTWQYVRRVWSVCKYVTFHALTDWRSIAILHPSLIKQTMKALSAGFSRFYTVLLFGDGSLKCIFFPLFFLPLAVRFYSRCFVWFAGRFFMLLPCVCVWRLENSLFFPICIVKCVTFFAHILHITLSKCSHPSVSFCSVLFISYLDPVFHWHTRASQRLFCVCPCFFLSSHVSGFILLQCMCVSCCCLINMYVVFA